MHAIVIDHYKEAGSVRVLPEPELDAQSVVVRVTVAGVNPVDYKIRAGAMGGDRFPLVLGQDFAGVVERAGANVTRVKAGDRVFGCAREHGSYAEKTVIRDGDHASPFTKTPDGLKDETVAALPTPALTALASLDLLGVTKGTDLLIIGAAGAVGGAAVQLAVKRGANVFAVVQPGQAKTASDFGATKVVEAANDILTPVQRMHQQPFGAVLDLVSDGETLQKNLVLYAKGGKLVTTIHVADEKWFGAHDIEAINVVMNETPASSPQGLDTIAAAVLAGDLVVPIAGERELTEAASVLDGIEAHELSGKYVLRVS